MLKPSDAGPAGCREVRGQLAALLEERLEASAARRAEQHLLECQACSEAYGELIMRQIDRESEAGASPLRQPPRVPPASLYDTYLSGREGTLGILWSRLQEALRCGDEQLRAWAGEQMRTVDAALAVLTPRTPAAIPAGARLYRSEPDATGPEAAAAKPALNAPLLSPAWEPTGREVSFTVEQGPEINAEGRLRIVLRAATARYAMHVVLCTLELPGAPAVTFIAPLNRLTGTAQVSEARLEEPGVGGTPGSIPLEQVRLAVVERRQVPD